MKKSNVKKIKWAPFEKLLAESDVRPSQTMGVGQRVFFVELQSPEFGSAYLRIPPNFALMSPRAVRVIYPVGEAYSKYYSELQSTLKKSPQPILSVDGEFMVSAGETWTFNKNLALATPRSAVKTFHDLKLATGVDVSDSSSSEEGDGEAEVKKDDEPEILLPSLALNPEEPQEVVIQFDSDDEVEDLLGNDAPKKKKDKHKNGEKKDRPEGRDRPKEGKKSSSTDLDVEVLQAGVLYPLITLKDLFKKARERSLVKFLTDAKTLTQAFENSLLTDLMGQIDRTLDGLKDRMAKKVADFHNKERSILIGIRKTERTLREAKKTSELSLDVPRYQSIINEAKGDLKELYIGLANAREDTKFSLRTFLASLDAIE